MLVLLALISIFKLAEVLSVACNWEWGRNLLSYVEEGYLYLIYFYGFSCLMDDLGFEWTELSHQKTYRTGSVWQIGQSCWVMVDLNIGSRSRIGLKSNFLLFHLVIPWSFGAFLNWVHNSLLDERNSAKLCFDSFHFILSWYWIHDTLFIYMGMS